jgi:hypothetical protein
MWRSLFLAVGVSCCLLGAQALAVEKAVLHASQPAASANSLPFIGGGFQTARRREIVPPDWAPWTLISAGAVTILYSFTLPARSKKE